MPPTIPLSARLLRQRLESPTDHAGLDNLTIGDPHPQYLLKVDAGGDGLPDATGLADGLALFTLSEDWVVRSIRESDIGADDGISSFSRAGSESFLVGDTVVPGTFSASYVGTVTAASISDNRGGGAEAQSSPFTSLTYSPTYDTVAVGNAVTWTLTATIGGVAYTKSQASTAHNYVFWGESSDGSPTVDASYASGLGSQAISSDGERTYSFTLSTGERAIVLVPTRLVSGLVWKDSNGFVVTADTLGTGTFDNGSDNGFSEEYTSLALTNPAVGASSLTFTGS